MDGWVGREVIGRKRKLELGIGNEHGYGYGYGNGRDFCNLTASF